MRKIRIAIVGVGNCASSLVQGINFMTALPPTALPSVDAPADRFLPAGRYRVAAAFDIDRRKVGLDVSKRSFAAQLHKGFL
jgi:myo-inositol-1-phosphate synthase